MRMNEAETRAELIDPKLKDSGWGEIEDTKILREYYFTIGKIQTGGDRAKPLKADYVLTYKNQKLAVIEAKSDELSVGEGVGQARTLGIALRVGRLYVDGRGLVFENAGRGRTGDRRRLGDQIKDVG